MIGSVECWCHAPRGPVTRLRMPQVAMRSDNAQHTRLFRLSVFSATLHIVGSGSLPNGQVSRLALADSSKCREPHREVAQWQTPILSVNFNARSRY